ncbi:MAG: magnesium/cobalt transporter CorA [Phycisphaerales bacterium]|nr:magnesium/cobalt transporter CorA [Phycisphaerales bacterium]
MMFRKRRPPAGSRPGTLALAQNALPPRISVIRLNRDVCEELVDVDVETVERERAAGDTLWVDVQGLGDPTVLHALADLFQIHPLALEDIVHTPQRPKTERYDEHQLYISRMVRSGEDGHPVFEQVAILIGSNYVLTFQEQPGDVLDPVRQRLRQGVGVLRQNGADYLAYAIIDTIIDYYYPIVEQLSDQIEAMEVRVMADPTPRTLARINRLKATLLEMRRGIWPQRDAVNQLIRDDTPFISDSTRVYLRDCYDHCVQLGEVIETYRELAAGLFNTYLSVVSNRTNEIMKVLTIMASIFIPLTLVAGVYGMNFDVMPELHRPWGYPAALGLMLAMAGGMLWYFGRKGWLRNGDPAATLRDDGDDA